MTVNGPSLERRWIVFGVCSSLFIMSMFYRVSGAIIAPNLTGDLDLSPSDLGLIGGAFFYSFAVVQIPLGLLLDRISTKRTMLALNTVGILGVVVFSCATGLSEAVLGRVLMGLGMAANLMGSLKLFINWFAPNRFATLSGLVISLGTLGTLAATSPLAVLVEALGWRMSFLALGFIHVIFILALTFLVTESPCSQSDSSVLQKEPPAPGAQAHSLFRSLMTLYKDRNYWAISFSIFLRYGSFASIQALWAGPFLIDLLGLSPVRAGNVLLMLSMGFILGAPGGGFISDRILKSRKKAVTIAMTLSSFTILAWSRWESSYSIIALGVLIFLNGFFNSFNQISYAHIRDLMPEEMSGTAMTGINVFTMMGAGVFVHGLGEVIGHLQDKSSGSDDIYRLSFLICAGAVFLSAVLYAFTTEKRDPARYPKTAA